MLLFEEYVCVCVAHDKKIHSLSFSLSCVHAYWRHCVDEASRMLEIIGARGQRAVVLGIYVCVFLVISNTYTLCLSLFLVCMHNGGTARMRL